MRVAHDDQVVKHENQNQQFSLYFSRFEIDLFTQKGVKIPVDSGLTSWPLGEGKK